MGQVKSSIPETQSDLENIIDDVVQKIALKEKDLEKETGNEERNLESIVTLKFALTLLQDAKKQLEKYKSI